jgi:hypothetical protein
MNLIDGKIATGAVATFGLAASEQMVAAEPWVHTANDWIMVAVGVTTVVYTCLRIYKLLKDKEK